MKSSTFLLLVTMFGWLSACQEDDTSGASADAREVFTVDEVVARAATLAPVALRPYDSILYVDSLGADTLELEEFGPFSVPATTSQVLENHYVILTLEEGYDAGIYLCDVYIAFANVTLPPGAFVWQAKATPEGYALYQGDTKVVGTSSQGATGDSTFFLRTWSIVPKYDPLGHSLGNQSLPAALEDVTFSYFYVQMI